MLLSVISITICSFYPSSKMDKENMHKTIQNVLGDELFFYALSMNQFADEQWSYPRFSNFPEKSHFEDEYISLMDRAVSCFQNDENVQYVRNGSWNVWRSGNFGAECESSAGKIPCGKSGV